MPLHASFAHGLSLSSALPQGRWFFGSEPKVTSCCSVADQCRAGDLFAVLDDQQLAAQSLVDLALERGAVGILAERPFPNQVPQFVVDDSRIAFGHVCHALAGHPSQSLKAIGITGTYGKSSVQRLLAGIFSATKGVCDALESPAIETGGAIQVAKWLAESRATGCQYAVIEASSQSLVRQQLAGCELDAAVITNVRREHAEWHGSLKNYQLAKRRLLDQLKPAGFAVLNVDDAVSHALLDNLDCPTITVGIQQTADVTATILERHTSEQTFMLDVGDESIVVRTHVIGDGHVYNCLSATAVALAMGLDPAKIVRGIEGISSMPNRLQRIECGQSFAVFVDACHTPSSLNNALQTLRPVCRGDLHCVVGVDHRLSEFARAQMGRTLERLTDKCVLTGSRFDHKMSLRNAHDVLDGFDRPAQGHLLADRAKAICWMLSQAKPGDVVLLAAGLESNGPDQVALTDEDVTRYWLQHQAQPANCPWVPA